MSLIDADELLETIVLNEEKQNENIITTFNELAQKAAQNGFYGFTCNLNVPDKLLGKWIKKQLSINVFSYSVRESETSNFYKGHT
jgi:hypothetical protein